MAVSFAMGFRILLCLAQGLQMAAQSSQSLTSGCSQYPGSVESYTENRCDGEEGSAFLQQSRRSLLGRTLRLETELPTCDLNTLNSGTCDGDQICAECDLSAGAQSDLPTNTAFFPGFRLLCEGNRTCSQVSGSVPFTFREAEQSMVCKGTETCKDVWRVNNVGAVCCSSNAFPGQTCFKSSFALTKSALCQNDMCCDGQNVCSESNMAGVESLSCAGPMTCSMSQVNLERDLICNEAASPQDGLIILDGGTCSNSDFDFVSNAKQMHAVDCIGVGDVCSNSSFTFEVNSTISMECNSAFFIPENPDDIPPEGGACAGATINLAAGACIDLNCTLLRDCAGMTVNLNGGECYVQGINTTSESNIPDGCEATNQTECGPVFRDEICCQAQQIFGDTASLASKEHLFRHDLDCSSCCEEPSTTTTSTSTSTSTTETTQSRGPDITSTTSTSTSTSTSTTTSTSTSTSSTTKPYPYHPYRNHRRNRRQFRRNRRQDRRQNRRQNRRQRRKQYDYR